MATALKEAPPVKAAIEPKIEEEAQLILFEGQPIKGFRLSFGGNVEIGDPDLIERLTLGQEVTVRISGYVSARSHKLKRSKDAAKPGAISHHTLVVQAVTPEK